MNWNKWIRTGHRWLSITFTAFVLANIVVNTTGLGGEPVALAIGLTTLLPLFGLLVTGLYMFALPYIRKQGDPT